MFSFNNIKNEETNTPGAHCSFVVTAPSPPRNLLILTSFYSPRYSFLISYSHRMWKCEGPADFRFGILLKMFVLVFQRFAKNPATKLNFHFLRFFFKIALMLLFQNVMYSHI